MHLIAHGQIIKHKKLHQRLFFFFLAIMLSLLLPRQLEPLGQRPWLPALTLSRTFWLRIGGGVVGRVGGLFDLVLLRLALKFWNEEAGALSSAGRDTFVPGETDKNAAGDTKVFD